MSYQEALKKINLTEKDVVDYREGKLISNSGEDCVNYPGFIILTKKKLFFVTEKGFLRSMRCMYDIELQQIKSIYKFPLINNYTIMANTAQEGAGFLKRMFKTKNAQMKISDGKTFVNKIKELNPKIK